MMWISGGSGFSLRADTLIWPSHCARNVLWRPSAWTQRNGEVNHFHSLSCLVMFLYELQLSCASIAFSPLLFPALGDVNEKKKDRGKKVPLDKTQFLWFHSSQKKKRDFDQKISSRFLIYLASSLVQWKDYIVYKPLSSSVTWIQMVHEWSYSFIFFELFAFIINRFVLKFI